MKYLKSLLLLTLLLSGCSSFGKDASDNSPVLARFDGQSITEKEFTKKLVSLPREIKALATKRKKEFIEDIAAEHFLLKEAQRRGIENDAEVKNLLEAAKKKIVLAKIIESDVDKKVSVTPDEIRKYYDDHKDEFMTPPLLRASHILVKTEEEAKVVKAQLLAGGDFEELARAKSIDGTAKRGGDLGFFQKGQFVPEFEAVAFQMRKLEVSNPVKTQFGYHIIKLTDQVASSLRDFESVKSTIYQRLANEKRARLFKALIEKLKSGSKIEFEEKAIESFSADKV